MFTDYRYQTDIDVILARRHDNGGDLWATADKIIARGGPFSTLGSALMLAELGYVDSAEMRDNIGCIGYFAGLQTI